MVALQRVNGEQGVHRSGTEAFQIQRDIRKPERFEDSREPFGHVRRHRTRQFFAGNFNSDNLTMMAHTELTEPKPPQLLFAQLNRGKSFRGYRPTVFDPRSQASRRWFVPDPQSGLTGKGSDSVLGQSGIEQGSGDAMVTGSFLPRPEVP